VCAENLTVFLQELFHGPTYAFKDVALQVLGNVFEYLLQTSQTQKRLTILGATSGDTGSAAMAGIENKKGVQCIILYPQGRVSERQELQMITAAAPNVHAVAVANATFDDCQDLVKASFATPDFRQAVSLGAVNSINWCRVLAQMTYYFWSYFQVTAVNGEEVHYSVPTGNFGDILAGYYAKRMGLPVGRLVVATNENDILHRFFSKGEYHRHSIQKTISPSMDICVSSNFERYLFHLAGDNPQTLKTWMQDFEKTKKLTLTGDLLAKAQKDFGSARADTNTTLQTIGDYSKRHDYLLCPHTAVGVSAAQQLGLVSPKMVCLATAHHAKFPDAVSKAIQKKPPTPAAIARLYTLPQRRQSVAKDLKSVQAFCRGKVRSAVFQEWAPRVLTTASLALVVAMVVSRVKSR